VPSTLQGAPSVAAKTSLMASGRHSLRTFLSVAIAAGCCLLAGLPVAASATSADDAAIRAAYKTVGESLVRKDAATLSTALSTQFYLRELDGTTETRVEFIKDATSTPGIALSSVT
jgi:hypothetical protein